MPVLFENQENFGNARFNKKLNSDQEHNSRADDNNFEIIRTRIINKNLVSNEEILCYLDGCK